MFKKQKKLDPKVRFHLTGFRKQLQNAREYKRSSPKTSESKFSSVLKKIGPKTILIPIAVVLGVLGLLYIIYIPNFLTVTSITINGLPPAQRTYAEEMVKNYLTAQPIKAQKNIFFLSKADLQAYLVSKDANILNIRQIKKVYFHSIIVNVTPRTNAFLLETPLQKSFISNDGNLQGEAVPLSTGTPQSLTNLITIRTTSTSTFASGAKIFNDQLISAVNLLHNLSDQQLKLPIDHFEIDDLQGRNITVITAGGFIIKFDITNDLQKNINQLQLLLNNLEDSQRKNLYYIDMRFEGRGFVCLKNTPCTQSSFIQNNATSSNVSDVNVK
jgi:cell division septal protein FtsQ